MGIISDDGFEIELESNELSFDAELGESFDYNLASNKPRINDVEIVGTKSSSDFGLQDSMDTLRNSEIDDILFSIEEG